MRSKRDDPGQPGLWDELVAGEPRPRAARVRVDLHAHEVVDGRFASRGWHPGSILYFAPVARCARGQIVVMRRGEELRAGEYDLVWGRPVLRDDAGSIWLGPGWALAGVVRMVEPPLMAAW